MKPGENYEKLYPRIRRNQLKTVDARGSLDSGEGGQLDSLRNDKMLKTTQDWGDQHRSTSPIASKEFRRT